MSPDKTRANICPTLTRFIAQPSDAAREAFACLVETVQPEERERVAAAVLADLRRTQADKTSKEVDPTRTRAALTHSRGRDIISELPADDHASAVSPTGCIGDAVYISEPYQITLVEMREIVTACDRHGLTVTVSGGSAWFPGSTVKLEYRRTEKHALAGVWPAASGGERGEP